MRITTGPAGTVGNISPNQRVALYSGAAAIPTPTTAVDGDANAVVTYRVLARAHGFNGTTWDRLRDNEEVTLLASAARSASNEAASRTLYNRKGLILWLRITAVPGVDTVQLAVQFWNNAESEWVTHLSDAATASTGNRVIVVYPGVTATTGIITAFSNSPMPRRYRGIVTHVGAGSFTYSMFALEVP